MIQFNLLPDVKKDYVKAKKTKHLTLLISIVASGAAVAIVLVFFSIVKFGQRDHIQNLTDDINEKMSELQAIEDLNKMLTVQSQLTILPVLHEQKPETSRLFTYLSQIVPEDASLSSLGLDMITATISMSGQADSIATINKLVDALKQTTYQVSGSPEKVKAFTLTSTRLNGDNTTASFQIGLTFDQMIFNNTKKITLNIVEPKEDASSKEVQ